MSSTAGRPGFAGRECAAHHGDAGEVDNHLTNIGHVRLEVFLPHIAYVAGLLVRGFHCRRAPELGINWFQPHQNPKGLLKQLRTGEGVSGHFRPGLSHEAPLGVRRPQLSALSATFAEACSVRSYMTSVWTSLRPLKARATQRGHSQCAAAEHTRTRCLLETSCAARKICSQDTRISEVCEAICSGRHAPAAPKLLLLTTCARAPRNCHSSGS